ncbi:MAG: histidine phosphatase family protein [Alphaproteobacteria bacterium]|nr:histidine phosphatase family protein [Alphaproteobacteria bacterium]
MTRHNNRRTAALLCGCLAALLILTAPAYADRSIYVVRHGERDNCGDLVPRGQQRAVDLLNDLLDENVVQIFVSKKHRTRDTARPLKYELVRRHILTPDPLPVLHRQRSEADYQSKVVNKVLENDAVRENPQGAVLIVSHSEYLHEIANAFAKDYLEKHPDKAAKKIKHDQYDLMYIVTFPTQGGVPTLTKTRYGSRYRHTPPPCKKRK